ncbi:hypothetical protein N3K66_001524 [Trichothecium roseum]|uniref:Uncharacterized protein n=1 Tax=Trichothecium roseum TaxID=47278 RepID=A0ACC0VGN2_9HYPO|nr:hypothetical protein N3K66_001524 [Trichothecium roseum]
MSQEEPGSPPNPSPKKKQSSATAPSPPEIIPNTPLPDPASWEHVVVALSAKKQGQLLKGTGHDDNAGQQPGLPPYLSAWPIIAKALSAALLSRSDGLYVQSSMEVHRKDFLLFTRTDAVRKDGTGGILEMHIANTLPAAAPASDSDAAAAAAAAPSWQGHWQEARPTIVHFVKQKFSSSPKADAKTEEPGGETDAEGAAASAPAAEAPKDDSADLTQSFRRK